MSDWQTFFLLLALALSLLWALFSDDEA